jgi:hypothetical protein
VQKIFELQVLEGLPNQIVSDGDGRPARLTIVINHLEEPTNGVAKG